MSEENKNFRILIVDDTLKNVQVLGTILRKENYQINVAQNGLQALEMVEKVKPDLILLDVMMPELDGFETCKRLKTSSDTKDIPVIFLTAKTETDDLVRGFEVGAVDYVTKPFNPYELLERVHTHVQLQAARQKLDNLAGNLSKYLSPQVYDSMFSGKEDIKIESYRRDLSVFFSDIVEFATKTEAMKPQELTEWLNNYLDEMAETILAHEGTLDKFIGDAILGFFGDPQSYGPEADALKCVRMATEMQERSRNLGIDVRLAISSGECTVGNFGSHDRKEYTIFGEAVNTASRLLNVSEPGRILVSESTHDRIKDAIPCQPGEDIQLKGSAESITTYWV